MNKQAIVSDFTVCFANVNGSGSASANTLFARSIYRMGCPVGIKNIFPSNIQGLPTWFEVRVSPTGFLGRSGVINLMVAMNINSLDKDILKVAAEGCIIYDSSLFLDQSAKRADIQFLGIPIKNMASEVFPGVRERILLQNMMYLGVLFNLLNMPTEIMAQELRKQFKSEKIRDGNQKAFDMGFDYAQQHFTSERNYRIPLGDRNAGKILIDGNTALGLGCLAAGATIAAWYPITPSTSVIDNFAKYAEKFRVSPTGEKQYAVVQAEDEIAAIGIVLGATWNGARAFTATSGPGLSLMMEILGYAFYAEIPLVIFDIQRCGPSTGLPTRTQQADLISAAYASHADSKQILLFPKDPAECFTFAIEAFNAADRYQTPVIVMSDIDIGMNLTLSDPLKLPKDFHLDRGKIMTTESLEELKVFGRYLDVDGDGIPYRTLPGTHPSKGAFTARGSGHNKMGQYTEDAAGYKDNLDRVFRKIAASPKTLPAPEISYHSKAKPNGYGMIYFGSSSFSAEEAIDILHRQGYKMNSCRIRAFPFHSEIRDFIVQHRKIFVIEQNATAQLAQMLCFELKVDPQSLKSLLYYDGQSTIANMMVMDIITEIGENKIHG